MNGEQRADRAEAERRAGARHRTILRTGLLHTARGKELCIVKNLSEGGFQARVYRSLDVDEPVTVELKSGEVLEGSVIWCRGFDVGIAFNAPVDVPQILSSRWATETGRRPRMPRLEIACRARIRIGAIQYRVEVCDISQGGLKISFAKPLASGTSVVISLPDLPPLDGTVKWSDDCSAGLAFNEYLPMDLLVRWLKDQDAEPSMDNSTDAAAAKVAAR